MRNKTHYLKMNIEKLLLVMKGNKYQEINFYHTKKKKTHEYQEKIYTEIMKYK